MKLWLMAFFLGGMSYAYGTNTSSGHFYYLEGEDEEAWQEACGGGAGGGHGPPANESRFVYSSDGTEMVVMTGCFQDCNGRIECDDLQLLVITTN